MIVIEMCFFLFYLKQLSQMIACIGCWRIELLSYISSIDFLLIICFLKVHYFDLYSPVICVSYVNIIFFFTLHLRRSHIILIINVGNNLTVNFKIQKIRAWYFIHFLLKGWYMLQESCHQQFIIDKYWFIWFIILMTYKFLLRA